MLEIKFQNKFSLLSSVFKAKANNLIKYPIKTRLELVPIKRSFSTKNILSSKIYLSSEAGLLNLNPWFVTGFIDGEGSFGIQIIKTSDDK